MIRPEKIPASSSDNPTSSDRPQAAQENREIDQSPEVKRNLDDDSASTSSSPSTTLASSSSSSTSSSSSSSSSSLSPSSSNSESSSISTEYVESSRSQSCRCLWCHSAEFSCPTRSSSESTHAPHCFGRSRSQSWESLPSFRSVPAYWRRSRSDQYHYKRQHLRYRTKSRTPRRGRLRRQLSLQSFDFGYRTLGWSDLRRITSCECQCSANPCGLSWARSNNRQNQVSGCCSLCRSTSNDHSAEMSPISSDSSLCTSSHGFNIASCPDPTCLITSRLPKAESKPACRETRDSTPSDLKSGIERIPRSEDLLDHKQHKETIVRPDDDGNRITMVDNCDQSNLSAKKTSFQTKETGESEEHTPEFRLDKQSDNINDHLDATPKKASIEASSSQVSSSLSMAKNSRLKRLFSHSSSEPHFSSTHDTNNAPNNIELHMPSSISTLVIDQSRLTATTNQGFFSEDKFITKKSSGAPITRFQLTPLSNGDATRLNSVDSKLDLALGPGSVFCQNLSSGQSESGQILVSSSDAAASSQLLSPLAANSRSSESALGSKSVAIIRPLTPKSSIHLAISSSNSGRSLATPSEDSKTGAGGLASCLTGDQSMRSDGTESPSLVSSASWLVGGQTDGSLGGFRKKNYDDTNGGNNHINSGNNDNNNTSDNNRNLDLDRRDKAKDRISNAQTPYERLSYRSQLQLVYLHEFHMAARDMNLEANLLEGCRKASNGSDEDEDEDERISEEIARLSSDLAEFAQRNGCIHCECRHQLLMLVNNEQILNRLTIRIKRDAMMTANLRSRSERDRTKRPAKSDASTPTSGPAGTLRAKTQKRQRSEPLTTKVSKSSQPLNKSKSLASTVEKKLTPSSSRRAQVQMSLDPKMLSLNQSKVDSFRRRTGNEHHPNELEDRQQAELTPCSSYISSLVPHRGTGESTRKAAPCEREPTGLGGRPLKVANRPSSSLSSAQSARDQLGRRSDDESDDLSLRSSNPSDICDDEDDEAGEDQDEEDDYESNEFVDEDDEQEENDEGNDDEEEDDDDEDEEVEVEEDEESIEDEEEEEDEYDEAMASGDDYWDLVRVARNRTPNEQDRRSHSDTLETRSGLSASDSPSGTNRNQLGYFGFPPSQAYDQIQGQNVSQLTMTNDELNLDSGSWNESTRVNFEWPPASPYSLSQKQVERLGLNRERRLAVSGASVQSQSPVASTGSAGFQATPPMGATNSGSHGHNEPGRRGRSRWSSNKRDSANLDSPDEYEVDEYEMTSSESSGVMAIAHNPMSPFRGSTAAAGIGVGSSSQLTTAASVTSSNSGSTLASVFSGIGLYSTLQQQRRRRYHRDEVLKFYSRHCDDPNLVRRRYHRHEQANIQASPRESGLDSVSLVSSWTSSGKGKSSQLQQRSTSNVAASSEASKSQSQSMSPSGSLDETPRFSGGSGTPLTFSWSSNYEQNPASRYNNERSSSNYQSNNWTSSTPPSSSSVDFQCTDFSLSAEGSQNWKKQGFLR